jgi:hypothetical protein
MSITRIIGAWGIVLGSFLAVGAVLALTSCDMLEGWDHPGGGKKGGKWPPPPPVAPLQVTDCKLASAPFVPPLPPKSRTFRLEFSEPVKLSTLKVPQTVRIVMNGAFPGGHPGMLPAGTFHIGPDHKTVVLVSALQDPAILTFLGGNPAVIPGGGMVNFQVRLLGTPDGASGVIKDASGHALDGDFDGKAGGVYTFGLNHHLNW